MPTPENQPSDSPEDSLQPEELTWAALLTRWTDFARSAVAFPKSGDGGRLRASVAPMIGLQAIVFALAQAHRLPPAEHALALDRAEMLIRRHIRELHDAWPGHAMPPELQELIRDARAALEAANSFGVEWLAPHDRFIAPDPLPLARELLDGGFRGRLLAAAPGTVLFHSAPLLFATPPLDRAPAGLFAGCAVRHAPGPRQLYRQMDDAGRPLRDLALPMDETLPPGRPLLVPIIEDGRLIAEFTPEETDLWRAQQEAWLDGRTLPVVAPQDAAEPPTDAPP